MGAPAGTGVVDAAAGGDDATTVIGRDQSIKVGSDEQDSVEGDRSLRIGRTHTRRIEDQFILRVATDPEQWLPHRKMSAARTPAPHDEHRKQRAERRCARLGWQAGKGRHRVAQLRSDQGILHGYRGWVR